MSLPQKKLNEAFAAIQAAQTIVISGHVNPDGDSLGSTLAMYWALHDLGKEVTPLSIDGVPETLRFLPGKDALQMTSEQDEFDLAILVDLEGLKRVGKNAEVIQRAKKFLVIDHHQPWEQLGDLRLIDTKAPATAMIVYEFLKCIKIHITPQIATCLLTGLVTDTGSFKFQNTTPKTLTVAAKLMRAGADIVKINEEVYESRSPAAMKLLGDVLANMRSLRNGEIRWGSISLQDFAEAGATDEHSEGIVTYLRAMQGAKVAVLFREVAPNRIRISLRSREPVNVAEIAQKFGGGGHHLASGCSINGSLEEAQQQLLSEVERWMDSSTSIKALV